MWAWQMNFKLSIWENSKSFVCLKSSNSNSLPYNWWKWKNAFNIFHYLNIVSFPFACQFSIPTKILLWFNSAQKVTFLHNMRFIHVKRLCCCWKYYFCYASSFFAQNYLFIYLLCFYIVILLTFWYVWYLK